jgi:hypothetical protein
VDEFNQFHIFQKQRDKNEMREREK